MTKTVVNADLLDNLGTVNAQTGATYTVAAVDKAKLVTFSNAASIAVTLPQAGSSFPNGWFADFQNRGAGTATITPTTSTVDGAASIALTTGQGVRIFSDGTNYFTQRGVSSAALTVKDEGSTLTTAASSMDFVGAGVTATNTGGAVTVTIPNNTTVLRNWISGLVLSNNTLDTANDIDIAVGEAADSTSTYLMQLSSVLTKRLDAAWAAGTNQGGLDTGAEAVSTWYHVWLIRKDSDGSTDALFSTSVSAPTMPSGYTAKRLIGSVYNNSSSALRQFLATEAAGGGVYTLWIDGVIDANLSSTIGTTNTNITLITPLGYSCVATIAVRVNTGTAQSIYVSSISDPQTLEVFRNVSTADSSTTFRLQTNSSSQIRAKSGTGTITTFIAVSIAWEWGRR